MGSGRWIGMLLVAVTAAACGGHSVRDKPDGAAGSSSTIHPTPTDPPPDNQEPIDDPPPVGVPEPTEPMPTDPVPPAKPLPVPCEYESLDVACANGDCPMSPDDFGDQCAKGIGVSKTSTVCGGTVVVIGFSFGQTSWYFDATGALTGIISVGDVEELCPDGHGTNARAYGSACQTAGIFLDACPPPPCGPPYMCVGGPDCPLQPSDVLSSYCNDPTTEVVRGWSTTCAGSALVVSRTDGAQVRYCYDAQDRLSGISKLDGLAWVFVGSDCETFRRSSLPCVPK